jgi:iron(III) transport system permease protein
MTRGGRLELVGGLLLIVLLWLIVYPLVLVLVEGFFGPDGWTLDFVRMFFKQRNEAQALWGSLWISLVSVVLAAVIGIPLAFLSPRWSA